MDLQDLAIVTELTGRIRPSGIAHHQFDEVHELLPQMAAGTTVKLQVDAEDTAAWYAIDVADFQEVAAPLTEPAGDISVTSYGADPTGVTDSTTDIQNAVNAGEAQARVSWIPQGTYLVTSHIIVNNVTSDGRWSLVFDPRVLLPAAATCNATTERALASMATMSTMVLPVPTLISRILPLRARSPTASTVWRTTASVVR